MSWQAVAVVDALPHDAVGPLAFRVLLKLANVAGEDGEHAFRHARKMAQELGVSTRSVQRALRDLEALPLIRRGNQDYTAHLPAGKRPVVYDLVMFGAVVEMVHIVGFDDVPEWPESDTTRLSTGTREIESDTTTADPLKNLTTRKKIRSKTLVNTPGNLPCGHRAIDARHCEYGHLYNEEETP